MTGEKNLDKLIRTMAPSLNQGDYVFVTVEQPEGLLEKDILGMFREKEGTTLILEKQKADQLGLKYTLLASWITLEVHSSLNAVGLTATFSRVLADEGISCNVVAGYFHDHIFVQKKLASKALRALEEFVNTYKG